MSFEEMSAEELAERRHQLLDGVPEVDAITNKALREKLGWGEDAYWYVRNPLIEEGVLEKMPGRGGKVRRVSLPAAPSVEEVVPSLGSDNGEQPPALQTGGYTREEELYVPMRNVISAQWCRDQGFDDFAVEITARQGSRQTGGTWSRPDITVFAHKTYPYVPDHFFEVVTFEVKPSGCANVAAVYEALAHRRAATQAYVVVHIPPDWSEALQTTMNDVISEAKKWSVGVMVAEDPTDFYTWEVCVEAERQTPDPKRLNDFIAQQTSQELKERIARWFK